MTECPDCYSAVAHTDEKCPVCGYVFPPEASPISRKSTTLSAVQPAATPNVSSDDPWADLNLDSQPTNTTRNTTKPKKDIVRGVVMVQEGTTTTPFQLLEGKTTLGRGEDNHIVLTDERVSGFHAVIYIDATNQRYLDVSSNGSVVNGTKIFCDKVDLINGSRIELGEALLTFVIIPTLG